MFPWPPLFGEGGHQTPLANSMTPIPAAATMPTGRRVGFHAAHELYSPSTLLRFVRRAERAGFRSASCSDHFHPWSERHAAGGFSWSWLGAALEATSLDFGVVCAPGPRLHPAVVAQAVATLAEMYPGRFRLAVGSGEAINESMTGAPWPSKPQRNARLKESVDIMRALWRGETVTHDGLVRIHNAALYTRPQETPMVIGAALTPETARWLGGWADGLITGGSDHRELGKVVDAFRAGGGEGKPLFLQSALAYAGTEEEALHAIHQQWRHTALDPLQLADLSTPRAFDDATASITPDDLRGCLRCSTDLAQHADWLQADFALGFEVVYLHYLGYEAERFIDIFADAVLPRVQCS